MHGTIRGPGLVLVGISRSAQCKLAQNIGLLSSSIQQSNLHNARRRNMMCICIVTPPQSTRRLEYGEQSPELWRSSGRNMCLVSISCWPDFPMNSRIAGRCTNLPFSLPAVCSHHSIAGISGIQKGWVCLFWLLTLVGVPKSSWKSELLMRRELEKAL